jgi:hypothetical protein
MNDAEDQAGGDAHVETTTLELGGRRIGDGTVAGLMLLATGALFCFHFLFLLRGETQWGSDTYEYADVGRNLAEGRGLVADGASVLEIARLGSLKLPIPYFVHDPGNSGLLAVFFAALGPTKSAIGWASGTCFILTVPLTYLLGARLYGRQVGLLAAFLAGVSSQLNSASVTGLSEGPAAFLMTLALVLLCGPCRPLRSLAAGLAVGALVALRQNALPFVPFFAVFLAFAQVTQAFGSSGSAPTIRRVASSLASFLFGFGLFFVPNAVRTAHYFGHPLHGVAWDSTWLCHTSAMSLPKASAIWRSTGLTVEPMAFFRAHPAELFEKMRYQLSDVAGDILTGNQEAATDAILVGLLALAVLWPPRESRAQSAVRWLFCACALTALLVGAAAFLRWRHLYLFMPLALVYVAEVVSRALGASIAGTSLLRRVRAAALMLMVAAASLGPVWSRPDRTSTADYVNRSLGRFVALNTPADAVILVESRPPTSLYALAWESRRQYVWYSDSTLASLEAGPFSRPLYALSIAQRPRGSEPLAGVGPSTEEGFVRVARFKDPFADLAAVLRRKKH